MDFITNVVTKLNDLIWAPVPIVLICTGLVFIFVTRGVQVRFFNIALKNIISGKSRTATDEINLSPFQSFMTGLASRVGTGNIAGVANAITIGGEGAVFWMWIAALIGMASSFAESSLAQLYKTKNAEGEFVGGPAFYIAQGLKLPSVGIVFSILLAFTYGFAFNSIQANQIAATVNNVFHVDVTYTAIAVTVLTAVVIFSSLKAVSRASGSIVSVMASIYILIGIFVLAVNYQNIIPSFERIFVKAFNTDAALGATIGLAIQYGIKRGLFSNEAGMGSAPNIAASAATEHPANQGFVQMIGVCFDTFVICTFSALIVITSGIYLEQPELTNAPLSVASVTASLGQWASYAMSLVIFLFAFSSIIGNFAYALSGLKYFTQNKIARLVFTLAVCTFVFIGSVAEQSLVWLFSDVFLGLMTFLNCIAILFLWKQVKLILDDYQRQRDKGIVNPEFNSDLYPVLRGKLFHQSIWSRKLDESHDLDIHK